MKVYGLVRFTKDLDYKIIGENKILKSSVAWNDKKNKGHFHDVVFWNRNAENVAKFFTKGNKIFIKNGDLSNNNYQDKEGKTVYQNLITVHEWEFVESNKQTEAPQDFVPNYTEEAKKREAMKIDVSTEMLPF